MTLSSTLARLPDPRSLRRARGERRFQRRALTIALLISCVIHAGAALLFVFARSGHAPAPTESGTVELVMVQQKGSAAARPAASSSSAAADSKPAQPAPQKRRPAPAPQETAGEPAPPDQTAKDKRSVTPATRTTQAETSEAETSAAASAASQGPAPTPSSVPAGAQPQPAAKGEAPVFDLSGTESDYNALAFGDKIVPATPDSRYHNNPPVYPREAALRGEHGSVVLQIHVAATGLALGADILESSGVASLDDAAVEAVRTWHFRPAVQEGRAVPFDMPFRFVFEAN